MKKELPLAIGFTMGLSIIMAMFFKGVSWLVAWKVVLSRRNPESTGALGLVGEQGVAVEEIGPERGKAFVHGELWEARAEDPVPKDARVEVERVQGLVVWVRPVP